MHTGYGHKEDETFCWTAINIRFFLSSGRKLQNLLSAALASLTVSSGQAEKKAP
jgi:hypothetical protein